MTKLRQKGFTIVELAIATAVFAVVLLLVSYGLIQIGRAYNKATYEARTRAVANRILDDVTNSIKFSGGDFIPPNPAPSGPNGEYRFCIGSRRYTYLLNHRLGYDSSSVMLVDKLGSNCNASTGAQNVLAPTANSTELMARNMFLDGFVVERDPSADGYYRVALRVVYGEESNLDAATRQCSAQESAFCATIELDTLVQQRID